MRMKNGCCSSEAGKLISAASFVILHLVAQHSISILYMFRNRFKCLQYSDCWSSNRALLFASKPQNTARNIHAGKHLRDLIHQLICCLNKHLFMKYIYIYIYIGMCVCM